MRIWFCAGCGEIVEGDKPDAHCSGYFLAPIPADHVMAQRYAAAKAMRNLGHEISRALHLDWLCAWLARRIG